MSNETCEYKCVTPIIFIIIKTALILPIFIYMGCFWLSILDRCKEIDMKIESLRILNEEIYKEILNKRPIVKDNVK